jgi:hypothetical protein
MNKPPELWHDHIYLLSIVWLAEHSERFRQLGGDGMDWIDLAEDTDQWRALVNMVMKLWVS